MSEARIEFDGELWDVCQGGEVTWEWPTDEHPKGRTIHHDYLLRRWRGGVWETRRAPHGEVVLTPLDPPA
jgi:hypothetical protein